MNELYIVLRFWEATVSSLVDVVLRAAMLVLVSSVGGDLPENLTPADFPFQRFQSCRSLCLQRIMSKEAYTPPTVNREQYSPPTTGAGQSFAAVAPRPPAAISYLCAGSHIPSLVS